MDAMVTQLEDAKLENSRYKEKIAELEKWIVMLLNNFYQGNPSSIESISKGLLTIDELRNDKFALKKVVLLERKK